MFCSSNDRKLIDVKCGKHLTLKPQLAYSSFLEILRLRHRSQIIWNAEIEKNIASLFFVNYISQIYKWS